MAKKIVAKGTVKSFEQALEFVGTREERIIADNTVIARKGPDTIVVKLYATDIVAYHRDGTFDVNAGGFLTVITLRRLNQFGPEGWAFSRAGGVLRGYSRKHDWSVDFSARHAC